MPNKPITIRGVTYGSMKQAAAALGIGHGAVSQAKRRGRLDYVGLGRGQHSAVPVRIRGVDYPSVYLAAKALGLAKSTVWAALDRGNLETVGLRKRRTREEMKAAGL